LGYRPIYRYTPVATPLFLDYNLGKLIPAYYTTLHIIGDVATAGTVSHAKLPAATSPIPTYQYPAFYRSDALLVAQPTASEHWSKWKLTWIIG